MGTGAIMLVLRVGGTEVGPVEVLGPGEVAWRSRNHSDLEWTGLLPDHLPLELWFRSEGHDVHWRTVPLYLDQSVAANGRQRHSLGALEFRHEQSFDRGCVRVAYWAERAFDTRDRCLARRCVVHSVCVSLLAGWTLESSALNAANRESHKVVLVLRWGAGMERLVWRPQHVKTDYGIAQKRSYTWCASVPSAPLELREQADRAADRQRLWPSASAAPALLSPRARLHPYVGDTETYHNADGVLPVHVGTVGREGLRAVFFNMRTDPPAYAELHLRARQCLRVRRRGSVCLGAAHPAEGSSEEEEDPEAGAWWVGVELAPDLRARVLLRPSPGGGVSVCKVRLSAYKYQESLTRMAMEAPPNTV